MADTETTIDNGVEQRAEELSSALHRLNEAQRIVQSAILALVGEKPVSAGRTSIQAAKAISMTDDAILHLNRCVREE